MGTGTPQHKISVAAGLAMVLVAAVVGAFPARCVAEEPKFQPSYSAICCEAEQKILAALLQRAPFQGAHGEMFGGVFHDYFFEVIDEFAAALNVPIVLDKPTLADHGVTGETEIDLNAPGLTVRTALDLLLKPLDLDWDVDGEVLWISSQSAIGERRHTRSYDVTSLFGEAGSVAEGLADPDELMDLVMNHVEPVSWEDVGGAGSISFLGSATRSLLVVSQTRRCHEAIAALLDDLRSAQGSQASTVLEANADDASAVEPAPANAIEVSPELVRAQNDFAVRLFQATAAQAPAENLILGPHSVALCLAMAHAGAGGKAAEELAAAIYRPAEVDVPLGDWGGLSATIARDANARGAVFRCANQVWLEESLQVLPQFTISMQQDFGTELQRFNIKQGTDQVARRLNAWVRRLTSGRIEEIVSPGALSSNTRLILANAMYVHASWDKPFYLALTKDEPFFATDGPIEVPMMHREPFFVRYLHDDTIQIVELPYVNEQVAMWFLLPADQQTPLARLEAELSGDRMTGWGKQLALRRTRVEIPRFEFEAELGLSESLATMGVRAAFSRKSWHENFTGISLTEPLYIDAVLHRAVVRVDEHGTEAAAATAGTFGGLGSPVEKRPEPIAVFRADRPFLFAIVHRPTGAILFLGRYVKPPAEPG